MITLFAVPKPFRGHISVIQHNAIKSWTLLRPTCEVILLGDEDGVADIAAEHHLRHIPDVARTSSGTPLISDLFKQAEMASDRPILCYVNSDIVLMSDFLSAVQRVARLERFLLVGHRWNLDVPEPIEFDSRWEDRLRRRVHQSGRLAGPTSIDMFVFSRGALGDIPPFAVGRPRWDNWMLYRARSLRMPLIDATAAITAVHQNHDYSHHPQGFDGTRRGEEALTNEQLLGGEHRLFSIDDATHLLTPDVIRLARDWKHVRRRLETLPVLYTHPPISWVDRMISSSRALRTRYGLTLTALSRR